ncbi:MAG: ATP-binding protein, partial [Candidatus Neomarinimicrobiota bacterium]
MMDWRKIVLITSLILTGIIRIPAGEPQTVTAKLKWSLKQVFKVPESALYDYARTVIYVSNINGSPGAADGNGFISRVSPDGKLLNLHWIDGLNAPKGMAIYRDTLYVTDLNAIALIDLNKAKLIGIIDLKAKFLNDITVDRDGTLFCSDNVDDIIYVVRNGQPTVWLSGGKHNPNGLLAEANRLVMLSSATGYVNFIDYQTKTLRKWVRIDGSPDGIVACRNGYLLSD